MAQTKKKRQTKHRGSAAGQITARGRTGRKPTADERKQTAKEAAAARRQARLDTPPTWKSAAQRAVFATGFFFLILVIAFKGQALAGKVGIAIFMLGAYTVLGYYTDLFIYRRRQRKKREQAPAKKGGE